MMEIFPTNIDPNVWNHIGMVKPFCGFSVKDCYQNHGLLSSTNALITQSHAFTVCLNDFLWLLYRVLNCTSEVS